MTDPVRNFGYTTVSAAPFPPESGTAIEFANPSVLLDPGEEGSYNLVVWPTGTAFPLASNAEIIRVAAAAGEVFTIDRTQEGTSAREILVGDQVAWAATAKTFTDLAAAAAAAPALSQVWTGVQINGAGEITQYASDSLVGRAGYILVGRNDALQLRQISGWVWDDDSDNRWAQIGVGPITLFSSNRVVGEDIGLGVGTAGVTSTAGHMLTLEGGIADRADEPGAHLQLNGGPSRGNMGGGDIVFQTTETGASATITEELVAGSTGADVEISGTLAQVPFLGQQTGTLGSIDQPPVITDAVPQTVTFNPDGTITGEIGTGGTNTWNPTTGDYSFSFAASSTGPVDAAYTIEGHNAFVEQARLRASDGALLMKPPTSDPGIPGVLWNNAGTLAIST